MQGRYTHIVADMSSAGKFDVAICSLGIMGMEYGRDVDPPVNVAVNADQTFEIDIEPIRALLPIGNELDIRLRQDPTAKLNFVSFNGYNRVRIRGRKNMEGIFTLKLESYDNNSRVKSALKKDTIFIIMNGPVRQEITYDLSGEDS